MAATSLGMTQVGGTRIPALILNQINNPRPISTLILAISKHLGSPTLLKPRKPLAVGLLRLPVKDNSISNKIVLKKPLEEPSLGGMVLD